MEAKPMSYLSLTCVLEHMEANKRFQLSWACPSIQKTEKVVPLKIERLKFNFDKLTINETDYELSICCNTPGNKINDHVGSEVYCVESKCAENVVEPGDVVIGNLSERIHESYEYNRGRYLLSSLQQLQRQLSSSKCSLQSLENRLQKPQPQQENESDSSYIRSPLLSMPINWEYFDYKKRLEDRIPVLEASIKETLNKLAPYLNRCGKIHTINESYIHFTISKPDDKNKQMLCIEYNIKLHEGQKRLNCHLFGKRRQPVQVKSLDIPCDMIIRLPLGLKLKIRELKAWGSIEQFCQAVEPIIDSSSYPLVSLETRNNVESFQGFTHPIIKNARKLIISNNFTQVIWYSVFLSLQNQKVYCRFDLNFSTEQYISIIQKWLETKRGIGSCFSFVISEKKRIAKLLNSVKNHFDQAIITKKTTCVTLPMNQTSDLCAYSESVRNIGGFEELFLKMEVVEQSFKRRHVSYEPKSTGLFNWLGRALKIPM